MCDVDIEIRVICEFLSLGFNFGFLGHITQPATVILGKAVTEREMYLLVWGEALFPEEENDFDKVCFLNLLFSESSSRIHDVDAV
jgi:hypothetical protein